MPRYLAIHTPLGEPSGEYVRPADLPGLAHATGTTRWLRTYTPDLHDDRHVSLWDAESAEDIRAVMEAFHFFVDAETAVFRVREWGPSDVLAARACD